MAVKLPLAETMPTETESRAATEEYEEDAAKLLQRTGNTDLAEMLNLTIKED